MIVCEFPDGDKAQLRHTGVDMIVVNEQKQVLLIKRSSNVSHSGKYGVPGGYLDRDESLFVGALREFKEETGFLAEIEMLFCINDQTENAIRKDDRQNVLCVFAGKIIGGSATLNREVSEIAWFAEKDLPREEEFAFDHRNIILKYFSFLKSPFPLPLFAKDL